MLYHKFVAINIEDKVPSAIPIQRGIENCFNVSWSFKSEKINTIPIAVKVVIEVIIVLFKVWLILSLITSLTSLDFVTNLLFSLILSYIIIVSLIE